MDTYDVSERAGVSIATVSKVLNDNVNVSEKTREEVLKVMDDLGCTPNVFARGLDLNTMQTIGITRFDPSNPYPADVIYYLERGLRPHNHNAILCCTGYDLDAKQEHFELLHPKRVDVTILVGSEFVEMRSKDNVYIAEVTADLPTVLVNDYLEGDNIYSTVCDDHAAVFGVTTQLLQTGRRRILYLYTNYSYSGVSRLEGYKDVLKTFGVGPKDKLIRQCPKDIDASRELLLSLREQGLSSDAVMTSDDSLVVSIAKYAHEAGISIPEKPSITGYNSSILPQCIDPEVTFINNKAEVLCTTIINTLVGVSSDVNMSSRVTTASDFIERKTTNF